MHKRWVAKHDRYVHYIKIPFASSTVIAKWLCRHDCTETEFPFPEQAQNTREVHICDFVLLLYCWYNSVGSIGVTKNVPFYLGRRDKEGWGDNTR